MKAVSLFSGAGGMDLGFHRAGWRIAAAVEQDAHAAETLTRNHPYIPSIVCAPVESLNGSHWQDYRGADVVFGGPPCQPFSAAGRGLGEWDPRDGIPHFVRAVRMIQPRAFVLENVRGLTFRKYRPYLERVLDEFGALGYVVRWRRLNAVDFGTPQFRDRLFVIGFREPECARRFAWPAPSHADPKGLLFGLKPWVTVGDALLDADGLPCIDRPSTAIAGDARMSTPGHHDPDVPDSQHGAVMLDPRQAGLPPDSVDGPARSLTNGNGRVMALMDTMHGRTDPRVRVDGMSGPGARRIRFPVAEPSPTVNGQATLAMTNGLGRAEPAEPAEPARTITARIAKDSDDLTGWVEATRRKGGGARKGERVARGWYRRLTPLECAALQAFPPDYIWPAAKTHAYRQIGNAVPPPLAEAVGRAVYAALERAA